MDAALQSIHIAIVSTTVPPTPSGQARALEALLAPDACPPPLWFTDSPTSTDAHEARHGPCIILKPPRFEFIPRFSRSRFHRADNWLGLASTVLRRAREIAQPLSRRRARVIIGCSGNPFDLPAAWLAARRMRLPFVAWLFDDPVMQWPAQEIYRDFARFWERLWSRRASAVIVPNEMMAAAFQARRPDVRSRVAMVRNPAAPACFDAPEPVWPNDGRPRVIVYTGSVYSAQADAFRNLVAALDRLEGRFVLHVYTAQSIADLAGLGITGPWVTHHPAVSHADSIAVQQQAQVLFLPLAFASPIGEVILSSAPGKTGEYLASGRPILAHAPRGSFVADFMARTGGGMVVDTPEPLKLAEALLQLDGSVALRSCLKSRATAAAEEFRVGHARGQLARVLASVTERSI